METKSEENQLKIAIPVLDMPTANYENALRELGARPVVIKEVCDPQEYDGLLLPGGDDVDPARFGQEINGSLGISPELDALQFEVLDRFVKAGKPVPDGRISFYNQKEFLQKGSCVQLHGLLSCFATLFVPFYPAFLDKTCP